MATVVTLLQCILGRRYIILEAKALCFVGTLRDRSENGFCLSEVLFLDKQTRGGSAIKSLPS